MRTGAREGRIVLRAAMLLAVLAGVVSMLAGYLQGARALAACNRHLGRIYVALERYETEHGTLPTLDFYPDQPMEDPASVCVALTPHGAGLEDFVCPSLPRSIQHLGLSYVWNVRLNGRPIPRKGPPEWMLAEVTALAGDVPTPHLGAYHVLYTDGTIRRVRHPLSELPGL